MRQVAKLMGWRVVGKNPSPWYTLRSTREVFDAFAEEEGLPRHCLPNHDMLRRCGRKDMVKGAEEWGGLEELAELLEYKVQKGFKIRILLQWKWQCQMLGIEGYQVHVNRSMFQSDNDGQCI